MRLSFFLKEALRGLRRSSAPALAALLTVLLTALVLGVFIPIVQATTGTANEVRSRVASTSTSKDSATQAESAELQQRDREHAQRQVGRVHLQGRGARARPGSKNPTALPRGSRAARLEPAARPRSASRPRTPTSSRRSSTSLAPGGEPRLAADRRGAQPRGGHRQDPVRHRPGQGAHGAARDACSCSPRSR